MSFEILYDQITSRSLSFPIVYIIKYLVNEKGNIFNLYQSCWNFKMNIISNNLFINVINNILKNKSISSMKIRNSKNP